MTQYRNAHNYLADFNSETPLYQQAGALVDALLAWRPVGPTLPARLEELYVLMYEMRIVGLQDVKLAQVDLRPHRRRLRVPRAQAPLWSSRVNEWKERGSRAESRLENTTKRRGGGG